MNKRNILTIFCALLLAVYFSLPVCASDFGPVSDEADILTGEEEQTLAAQADQISREYGCGVYIVTVWDYNTYGSTVRIAAEDYYLEHNLGEGEAQNGLLLFLSMAERDYALIAYGDLAHRAFTDYGKELLCDEFLDDFRYDDWYGGFSDYLSESERYLLEASQGKPVDVIFGADSGMEKAAVMTSLAVLLLIPGCVSGLLCGLMAAGMKTARRKTHANDYIIRKDFHISGQHDRFITRTVTRQRIDTSSSGRSRSSGGTRVSSRGFSGRSGKF